MQKTKTFFPAVPVEKVLKLAEIDVEKNQKKIPPTTKKTTVKGEGRKS